MKVLGISPLDKDATVSLVEDGRVLFAAGEERFSRQKHHAGFPALALQAALRATGTRPEEVDEVAYAFLDADREANLMRKAIASAADSPAESTWRAALDDVKRASVGGRPPVPGLGDPQERMDKGVVKHFAYWLLGAAPTTAHISGRRLARQWLASATADHRRYQIELQEALEQLGLDGKLKRYDHHLSHAANSYLASGLERALIVTLDGYGTGLAGSVSMGEGGRVKRLKNIRFPHSLGTFYENVTASLGYKPDRHAGKIVGLAAYGDSAVLCDVLLARIVQGDGTYRICDSLNHYFERYLSTQFAKIDVAAAYQYVLEVIASNLVGHWAAETGCPDVVLSGGVAANVKMNQRIFETEGVRRIFVYPNMGDGGCGTGLAMYASWPGGAGEPLEHVYHGPEYTHSEIQTALDRAGLDYARPANMAALLAAHIHAGKVVARFAGRMEYGPRALGNRSILFHAEDPDVNQWLNNRLGRTEFMPFAPVTCWEDRAEFYLNVEGAEHAARFMTITFDCTKRMRSKCPAAVHVDGTARPQLLRREVNPEYYDIVREFEKLSGVPTLINTSFNMHEEPIVCTPNDAVRAFLQGRLDVLAIGPFLVEQPSPDR